MSRILGNRHRDENGEIRRKNGNTTIESLRRIYGPQFAEGHRSDKKLENLLKDERASSLSELLHRER